MWSVDGSVVAGASVVEVGYDLTDLRIGLDCAASRVAVTTMRSLALHWGWHDVSVSVAVSGSVVVTTW